MSSHSIANTVGISYMDRLVDQAYSSRLFYRAKHKKRVSPLNQVGAYVQYYISWTMQKLSKNNLWNKE